MLGTDGRLPVGWMRHRVLVLLVTEGMNRDECAIHDRMGADVIGVDCCGRVTEGTNMDIVLSFIVSFIVSVVVSMIIVVPVCAIISRLEKPPTSQRE